MAVEFYQDWMKKCNPDLIVRFWRYKNRPGKLTLKKFGFRQVFINTVVGELCIKGSDIYEQLFKRTM